MDPVLEGVEAVTVHVTNVQKAREFYGGVLGLAEVSFHPGASRVAYALPGTSILLTMHPMGPEEGGRPPGTVSGVVFAHHDPKAACAAIKARGGTIVDEPETFTNPLGTVTLGVFADPDGNQFVIRHLTPANR